MNQDSPSIRDPLISVYASDEAIAGILSVFINNIPKYLDKLSAAIDTEDWAQAARVCHDLKGTAGGYGYPDIGRVAQQMEMQVKGPRVGEAISLHLSEFQKLLARARLGLGDATEAPDQ